MFTPFSKKVNKEVSNKIGATWSGGQRIGLRRKMEYMNDFNRGIGSTSEE